MRVLKIRRVMIAVGATDEQADEFVEAMDDLATKEGMHRALSELETRIINRVLIIQIGIAAVIIGAMALLTQL